MKNKNSIYLPNARYFKICYFQCPSITHKDENFANKNGSKLDEK
jgi:hypothetical protein